MRERIYNLFFYVENAVITSLGIVVHETGGTDDEKISFLQSVVNTDFKSAERYSLRKPLPWAEYQAMERLGQNLELFEEAFEKKNAPQQPLTVLTPIVDGSPRIMAITGVGPLDLDVYQGTPLVGPGVMVDYLKAYVTDGHFDLPRLIDDDYFRAIKLLYNATHFVSAAKLLMSFFDTTAFIEYGDIRGNFVRWLQTFADLAPMGINAEELWEFRNGLLHMTNLHSRAVLAKKVARLIFYVGDIVAPPAPAGEKYFNLKQLIDVVADAVSNWIQTYNTNPEKIVMFVSRYDLTISDSRLAIIQDHRPSGYD